MDSDDDSSGYPTDTSWKKNTTKEGTVHIMGATADASEESVCKIKHPLVLTAG